MRRNLHARRVGTASVRRGRWHPAGACTAAAVVETLEARMLLATGLSTPLLKDIYPGASGASPDELLNVNGTLYFHATNAAYGRELWKSNGTDAGTVLVKDVKPLGEGSGVSAITNVNGTIFFVASNGASGRELWKTNGTADGTVMVKDIKAGPDGAFDSSPQLVGVGGTLFLVVTDGVSEAQLWKSNGTEAGTVLVKDLASGSARITSLTSAGGRAFFIVEDGASGQELWTSNGTTAGTIKLATMASFTSPLVEFNGNVYFGADNGVHGSELWRSNGTTTGTAIVNDLLDGAYGSSPQLLVNAGGTLYFQTYDAVNKWRLCKSDGTTDGTVAIKQVRMDTATPAMTAVGATLYFEGYDSASGWELWKSNGTAAGTVMVKDVVAGTASPGIDAMANFNGTLVFTADDGAHGGKKLWLSDGTAAGTIYSGSPASGPALLTVIGQKLFFVATDSAKGCEVHVGTLLTQNTGPVARISGSLSIAEGGSSLLSGSGSTDADGGIVAYAWDWNYQAGTFTADATGVSASFSAAAIDGPATRTIALRVTDNSGATNIATATVTITNVAPTAVFSSGGTISLGQAGSVRFTSPTDPSAADISAGFTYSYDFDDDGVFGDEGITTAAATVPASYLDATGEHTIRGRITDKDGASRDYTTTITVRDGTSDGSTPTATLVSALRTAATATTATYHLTVRYADDVAINRSTIDSSDVRVTGSNSFSATAQLLSVSGVGDAGSLMAVYSITLGGPEWVYGTEHTFTISMVQSQVSDTGDRFVRGGAIGSLTVRVPPLTVSGVLTIEGTDAADTILISQVGTELRLTKNGGQMQGYSGMSGLMISGLGGDDTITLESPVNVPATIVGGAGNDAIVGGSAADLITGGGGRDTLIGGAGRDTLRGGAGDDLLRGTGGADQLFGAGGNDTLQGNGGADTLTGGTGLDLLRGGAGKDRFFAGDGLADLLYGGAGDDTATADHGLDLIAGVEQVTRAS